MMDKNVTTTPAAMVSGTKMGEGKVGVCVGVSMVVAGTGWGMEDLVMHVSR